MANQRHGAAFIVGAVLGGVAGAMVTLLNAPQAGARTRSQVATRVAAVVDGITAKSTAIGADARRLSAEVTAKTEAIGADARRLGERVTAPVTARLGGSTDAAATTMTADGSPAVAPIPMVPYPPLTDADAAPVAEVLPSGGGGSGAIPPPMDVVLDGPRTAHEGV